MMRAIIIACVEAEQYMYRKRPLDTPKRMIEREGEIIEKERERERERGERDREGKEIERERVKGRVKSS